MVMQGYTTYPPHILQKTPLLFLLNDVEEDSFPYRGGSLALPALFAHRVLRESSGGRICYHYHRLEEHFAYGGRRA